ncbi:hypothetical protein PG985_001868 [Apiospora marii]|uniref:uncharacterized protein n=1 Tax=Apiospora marii TaxID=335849 RepID=UPI00312F91E4
MNSESKSIKSVAVIGAGASGTITAAALKAEDCFDRIVVFERREAPGGTWIYDADPQPGLPILPGLLPPEVDTPLKIPHDLPRETPHDTQERFVKTPIYDELTTNVPDIAMCFSDARFAYGPFPPHWVPRQYLEAYFTHHRLDPLLVANTTVEDLSRVSSTSPSEQWKLTLRKHDKLRGVDIWWQEVFDAVVIANGHYSVPYVPPVKGLQAYVEKYPGRVVHSKSYRSASLYRGKRVIVIGNSASGFDITNQVATTAQRPVYQSRRSKGRFDGDHPPDGIVWKPVITEYRLEDGCIMFADGSSLGFNEVDTVIYCTGYRPSFPFWIAAANGGQALYDNADDKLVGNYWHTFFYDHPTLALMGMPRTLTFRSFEYQAVAVARVWAGRAATPLPPVAEQREWERDRLAAVRRSGTRFHDVGSPGQGDGTVGGMFEYFQGLYDIAGLGTLRGKGRVPPVVSDEMMWALEHVKKYPPPKKGKDGGGETDVDSVAVRAEECGEDDGWVVVNRGHKDCPETVN